jgi:uncharacterized membrane protein SirB2
VGVECRIQIVLALIPGDTRAMTDTYTIIKTLHLACAAVSISGFVLRGFWLWRGSRLLQARATRLLPHINDTLLFGAGVWLVIASGLIAKLAAIVVYILFGMVALKRGRTPAVRRMAFVAALGVFGYIVAVALTRMPWPFG